jgi:hypothetical protein
MELPASLQSLGGILMLAVLAGLFWMVFRRRPEAGVIRKLPEQGFAYEWVATPLEKAKPDLLGRFPELETALASTATDSIQLIRFGIFNMTETGFDRSAMHRPVTVQFPGTVDILSVAYGESLKTEPNIEEDPVVESGRVTLPTFGMAGRSTVIFNFILRGEAGPVGVTGEVEGPGILRRIS